MTARDSDSELPASEFSSNVDGESGRGDRLIIKRRGVLGALGATMLAPTFASGVTTAGGTGYGISDYGDPVYGSPDAEVQKKTLRVNSREATDITDESATLHGELAEIDGYDHASVYFEWSTGCRVETTEPQEVVSSGAFHAALTDLQCNNEYEFHAVAEAGSRTFRGDTVRFLTEEGNKASGPAEQRVFSPIGNSENDNAFMGFAVATAMLGVAGAGALAKRLNEEYPAIEAHESEQD